MSAPEEKLSEETANEDRVAEEKRASERLAEVYRQAKEALKVTDADYMNGAHQPLRVRQLALDPDTYEIDFHRVGTPPVTYTYAADPDAPIELPALDKLPRR